MIKRKSYNGITSDFQSDDWGSIPYFRSNSPIAQLVEQLTVNQSVAGSSPARGAMLTVAQSVELQIVVLVVASSILVCQPKKIQKNFIFVLTLLPEFEIMDLNNER